MGVSSAEPLIPFWLMAFQSCEVYHPRRRSFCEAESWNDDARLWTDERFHRRRHVRRHCRMEYQAVRRQVQELDRNEPRADEPTDVHEGFERLAKATVRAEQMARDALSNAVTSFAGSGAVRPSSLLTPRWLIGRHVREARWNDCRRRGRPRARQGRPLSPRRPPLEFAHQFPADGRPTRAAFTW